MKNNRTLATLEAEIRSKDGSRRERARHELVKMGNVGVPFLMGLLKDTDDHVRWEACMALSSIGDPGTAPALVEALTDESVEVQWLAAEALIALGEKAVPPLLRGLQAKFNSPYFRQSAHHVLCALERKKKLNAKVMSVLDALRPMEPRATAALAARAALNSLRRNGG